MPGIPTKKGKKYPKILNKASLALVSSNFSGSMLSKFESLTRTAIKALFPEEEIFYNYRPDWLKFKHGCNLELDIFLPKLKLAIEANGFSHQLNYQIEKDRFKFDACKKNGVTLVSITHPGALTKYRTMKAMEDCAGYELPAFNFSFEHTLHAYRPRRVKELKHIERALKRQNHKQKPKVINWQPQMSPKPNRRLFRPLKENPVNFSNGPGKWF